MNYIQRMTIRLEIFNRAFKKALLLQTIEIYQYIKIVWKKRYPQTKRIIKKQLVVAKAKATPILRRQWTKFKRRPLDVQIAIVVSVLVTTALLFGTWHWFTITCMVLAVIVVWSIVYRKYTGPAIHNSSVWVLKTTKPSRDAFGKWLSSVLYGEHGLPIAMIGWGVISFILFWLTFYFFKEAATFFGMVGWCGVIFGTIFYAIRQFKEYCEIKAREAEALAKIKPKARPRKKATAKTATSP